MVNMKNVTLLRLSIFREWSDLLFQYYLELTFPDTQIYMKTLYLCSDQLVPLMWLPHKDNSFLY